MRNTSDEERQIFQKKMARTQDPKLDCAFKKIASQRSAEKAIAEVSQRQTRESYSRLLEETRHDDGPDVAVLGASAKGISQEILRRFDEKDNAGKGDCLPLSLQLFKEYKSYSVLDMRGIAADGIDEGAYSPFIRNSIFDKRNHVPDFVRRLRHQGTWFNNLAIDALAKETGRPIVVVKNTGEGMLHAIKFPGRDGDHLGMAIDEQELLAFDGPVVLNKENIHYVSLLLRPSGNLRNRPGHKS